jgi:hypothetical protein
MKQREEGGEREGENGNVIAIPVSVNKALGLRNS